jgi:hypothetical protein
MSQTVVEERTAEHITESPQQDSCAASAGRSRGVVDRVEDETKVDRGDKTGGGDMNREIQAPGILLAELREAYQSLPQHIQGQVRCLLREGSSQKPSGDECALTL